ncbi:MAG: type II secretion system F family protein [Bdellovibrionales bacterium]
MYTFVSSILASSGGNQVLHWATDDAPEKSKSGFIELSRPIVHKFCLGLAAKIKSPRYRKAVLRKIQTAGLERVLNVDEFIGIQVLWGFLFPVLLMLVNLSLELGYPPLFVLIMSVVGAYFPHLYVNAEKKRRYTSVIVDLPYFIDILALSTEAGLDFVGAIQRVVDKAENSVLASELGQVLQDIKLGQSRAESLKAMANRLDMSEITSFIAVLVDADATGASIGQVLKQQSVQMRVERFTRAEKAGARASQAILIPLMMFILPAVFIMVFGPVILQFMGQGSP